MFIQTNFKINMNAIKGAITYIELMVNKPIIQSFPTPLFFEIFNLKMDNYQYVDLLNN